MYKVALVYQLRNADFFRRGGKLGYPERMDSTPFT